jgi:caffeoyl-CoA O-methyltransferase
MSNEVNFITHPLIEDYCKDHCSKPSNEINHIFQVTSEKSSQAHMQVGLIEGRLLSLLTKMSGAKSVIEFGTFTGYSALCIAEALPDDGSITTLDRDPVSTQVAKDCWSKSAHGKKINLILGDAHETVKTIQAEIKAGSRAQFDFAFIDADKRGYKMYWEHCFSLLKKGGLIIVDNVLWSGGVVQPGDPSDFEMISFNDLVKNDTRVERVMLPVRDGITIARLL